MKKQHAGAKEHTNERKVVRLRMDAGFFFERAVRSLDRQRFDKALKYFRLAVEKEPENPVNQCNLAGILSEMGHFDESNEVLGRILDDVDPDLSECYFYMANNAANMDDFEQAEEYLIRYLEEDPSGEFVGEAEEMLEMLAYEMGRQPRRPTSRPKNEWLKKHEEARGYLEAGQFLQAIQTLEKLVEQVPDFTAAMNNLSLAYYYTGELDRSMETITKVLDAEPNNMHALCNLAVISQHQGDAESRDRLVRMLKKWAPYHLEHTYKLATTMGVLGEHTEALRLFRQLIKLEKNAEPGLYHCAAAAACNLGQYDQANGYWRKAQRLDPDSEIPGFYLHQLEEWQKKNQGQVPTVSYHYQLPFEEQLLKLDDQSQDLPEQLRNNPLIRSSFFWALNHGDKETKVQVLQVFEYLADQEVEQVLRSFLTKRDEEDDLKRLALYVLNQIGAKEPYQVVLNGKETEIQHFELSQEWSDWMETWEQVLECCLAGMRGSYDIIHMNDAQIIWTDFLRHNQSRLPEIRKVQGWAAALEYVVAKLHGISLTQESVAKKHEVSSSTVRRHVRLLEQAYQAQRDPAAFSWRTK